MTKLARYLTAAAEAAEEVRDKEAELEESRKRFRKALRSAHEAGASYGLIGKMVGLTRQRVARIVSKR